MIEHFFSTPVAILYLLNVVFASGQSALGKLYAKGGGDSSVFNINKAIAGMSVFLVWGLIQGFSLHWPTVLFAVAYGVSLCLSMHAGFKALAIGPMALTSIIASFSLLIPFFFGICFWNEPLTVLSVCGIVLLLFSIFLINGKRAGGISVKWLLYAVTTLVANGICSIVQKYHQLKFPALYRTEFMFFALLCVLVILVAATIRSNPGCKQPFTFSVSGLVSGALNGGANYIVLFLSATENASVLFPIVSVANIAAVWMIGVVFFKEKLTVLQTVGLLIGAVSVLLLKL